MILPVNIDVVSWADAMTVTLSRYGSVGVLRDAAGWRSWARNVSQLPTISSQNPPNPDFFEDWQDWAARFIQVPAAQV